MKENSMRCERADSEIQRIRNYGSRTGYGSGLLISLKKSVPPVFLGHKKNKWRLRHILANKHRFKDV